MRRVGCVTCLDFSVQIYLFFDVFFFFNDTATTEIYTLSLHDALPILLRPRTTAYRGVLDWRCGLSTDRKSTRLNSSHTVISYAVFCLKKTNITSMKFDPMCNPMNKDTRYQRLKKKKS